MGIKRRPAKPRKGHKVTKETRDKLSKALTGKILSEETRKKISEIQTGKSWEDKMGKEKADKLKIKASIRLKKFRVNFVF